MAKMGIVENGLTKTRRRRRNPRATTTGVAKRSNPVKRRSISKASALSVLKKNGLKAVSIKSVANGRKRKRRRRNGLVTRSAAPRTGIFRNNGLLGNSKQTVKNVAALGVGAVFTKIVGQLVNGFTAPYLSQMGVGNYSQIICDAGVALIVTPLVAAKVVRGSGETPKMASLGGALVVGLDVVGKFAPGVLQYNPFVTNSIVMTPGGAAVAPATVAALAAGVANSSNPSAAAAKVGSAMAALNTTQVRPTDFAGRPRTGDLVL